MRFLALLLTAAAMLAQEPETAEAHIKKAEAEWAKSHFVEAETEYKKAQTLDGRNPVTWWGLARIAELYSFHGTAAAYLRRAHDLAPASPDLELAYARTLDGAAERTSLEDYLKAWPAGDEKALGRIHSRIDFLKEAGDRESVLATPYESSTISLVALMDGPRLQRGWGLSVSLNGNRPVVLVLDTGAGGILLNRKAAERSGVKRIADTLFAGLGDEGKQSGYEGLAQRVKIGNVEWENMPITVSDRKMIVQTDGLIGTDTFEKFLVTLDFPAKLLRLDPLLPRPGGRLTDRVPNAPDRRGWVSVYRFRHLLFLRTRVNESAPVLFLLDTGSENTLIDRKFAAALTKVNRDDYRTLKGVSGKVNNVYNADKLTLQFAGFRQLNQDVLTLDLTSLGGTETPGILGISVLNLFKFSIDYRDGVVLFDYKGPR